MVPSRLHFMVREMTPKHLAAINRGRKAAGLKPIRMKKKSAILEKKMAKKLTKLKKPEKFGDKNQKQREKEFNEIFDARIKETKDPKVKAALRKLKF